MNRRGFLGLALSAFVAGVAATVGVVHTKPRRIRMADDIEKLEERDQEVDYMVWGEWYTDEKTGLRMRDGVLRDAPPPPPPAKPGQRFTYSGILDHPRRTWEK